MMMRPSFVLPVIGALLSACLISGQPGICLIVGFLLSLVVPGVRAQSTQVLGISKQCLAWAIVGLGATVQIRAVYELSMSNLLLTLGSITGTLMLGWYLGALFKLSPPVRALISAGTAICGASAIAAVGGAIRAKPIEISIALGVVLLFNTLALFIFPWVGHQLALSPASFATWAGIAIHDTSSVVGAAMSFSPDIVSEATTIKLARAIWIAPLTLIYSRVVSGSSAGRFKLPWFIWGFWLSSLLCSFLVVDPAVVSLLRTVARSLFAGALFLLGTTLDPALIRRAGFGPVVVGGILWVAAAVGTLLSV